MNPHPKSEMLPYTGGKTVTFRAYDGDNFKDTDLDVQSVLARHYEEPATPVKLLDFSAEFCVFETLIQSRLYSNQKNKLHQFKTYTGSYICTVSDFFKYFFAQEVESAILLDLEQEYKSELGERGDVEAEDRNDYFNCL